MSVDAIGPFMDAVNGGPGRPAERVEGGRRYIGYFCTYTPVELIHAAGFTPVRINGGGETTGRAELLTPSFLCPFLRRAVERGLDGEYEFLDGLVQGYTCDAACGVVNVWADNIGGRLVHSLPLPYNDVPAGRAFFRAALAELEDKLATAGDRVDDASLAASLDLYADIRCTMLELYERRYDGMLSLTAGDFLTVIRAGFVTPPEDYREMLQGLLARTDLGRPTAGDGLPVLVSGSVIEDAAVLDLVEECGGRVAADDLCTGLRAAEPADGRGDDPWQRLIDRYMNRAPCPARAMAEDRAGMLLNLAGRSGAKGVIFILQKFCTPHLADVPTLTDILKNHDLPVLTVEIEETGPAGAQLKTRFETFFDILGR